MVLEGRATALSSDEEVVCVSTGLDAGKDTGTARVEQPACGSRNGSGMHIQVLPAKLLQTKTGNGKKTSKERRCMELHNYNTMYMASLEIKTFDVAKQKVIAKVRQEIGVHAKPTMYSRV